LTAELNSPAPVLLAADAVDLVACLLPLRTHRRTVWLAALVYLAPFGTFFLGHAIGNGARHDLTVTALFVGLAAAASVASRAWTASAGTRPRFRSHARLAA
jgi:uncharacterized membrane protein